MRLFKVVFSIAFLWAEMASANISVFKTADDVYEDFEYFAVDHDSRLAFSFNKEGSYYFFTNFTSGLREGSAGLLIQDESRYSADSSASYALGKVEVSSDTNSFSICAYDVIEQEVGDVLFCPEYRKLLSTNSASILALEISKTLAYQKKSLRAFDGLGSLNDLKLSIFYAFRNHTKNFFLETEDIDKDVDSTMRYIDRFDINPYLYDHLLDEVAAQNSIEPIRNYTFRRITQWYQGYEGAEKAALQMFEDSKGAHATGSFPYYSKEVTVSGLNSNLKTHLNENLLYEIIEFKIRDVSGPHDSFCNEHIKRVTWILKDGTSYSFTIDANSDETREIDPYSC